MTTGAKGLPLNVILLVALIAVGFEVQLALLPRQYDRNSPPSRVTGLPLERPLPLSALVTARKVPPSRVAGLPLERPLPLLTLVTARKVTTTVVPLDQAHVVEDTSMKSKRILQFHVGAIIFAKSVALSKIIITNCPLTEN